MSPTSSDPNTTSPPGFEILAKLGEGGMGSVWRARDLIRDRDVAIKFVDPDHQADEDARARFAREARVMATVGHDHIVQVFDYGTDAGRAFLVMELVDGRTLREQIERTGPLAPARARDILRQIGAAVACLHEQDIVHRDLKPGNVLIADDGTVKLTDFGISSPIAELGRITCTNEFVGSLDYMSPEQRTRLPVDARADQFALAVVAYEMLTGRLPIGSYKEPSELQSHLHPDVDDVLARALAEDADDRYPTITAFVERLATALDQPVRRASLPAQIVAAIALLLAILFCFDAIVAGEPPARGPNAAPTAQAPRPTTDWGALAQRQFAAGNLEAATRAMDEAIRLDDGDANLFRIRGLIHKTNGMYELALADLLQAYAMDPEFVDALVGAASVHVHLKDYRPAIDLCDRAIEQAPQTATAFAWRGFAHHGVGDDERARRDLDRAIELDPDCGVAYQWRGQLAKRDQLWAQVGHDYREFVRCHPDDPYAHRLYASFLALCDDRSRRDGELAVQHATRACELTRWQSWAALRVLAYAQAESGELAAAIETCGRALALAPENRRDLVRGQRTRYQHRLQRDRRHDERKARSQKKAQ